MVTVTLSIFCAFFKVCEFTFGNGTSASGAEVGLIFRLGGY